MTATNEFFETSKNQMGAKIIFFALLFLGIAARAAFITIESLDMKIYLLPWYDYIVVHGAWSSLGDEFSNYSPPYLYLLALITYSKGFIGKIVAIKLLSILFDFINIFFVIRIVRLKTQNNALSLISGALFFCLPTIILNSSAWGQADSIFTCFLLISMYFLLQDKPLPAILSFGVAFAFKAQAIFFLPFLLLLTMKKRIPWHYHLLIPVVYLIMMLPALFAGRSFSSVLGVYSGQVETYKALSMKAPNLYLLIPNEFYTPVLYGGVLVTILATLIWAAGYAAKTKELNKETMMICAAVSVAMIPFLLPKMHERYFYLMDVFTLLLAFYIPRLWAAPVWAQVISCLTYYVFLVISPQKSPSPYGAAFLILAVFINTFLLGYMLWQQYRLLQSQKSF